MLIQIRQDPSLLLLLILPTQSKKSIKAPFTSDVRKNTVLGVGSCANIVLGFTSYCICHSTPPLVLYFLYITHNCASTYTCWANGTNYVRSYISIVHSSTMIIYFYQFTQQQMLQKLTLTTLLLDVPSNVPYREYVLLGKSFVYFVILFKTTKLLSR